MPEVPEIEQLVPGFTLEFHHLTPQIREIDEMTPSVQGFMPGLNPMTPKVRGLMLEVLDPMLEVHSATMESEGPKPEAQISTREIGISATQLPGQISAQEKI